MRLRARLWFAALWLIGLAVTVGAAEVPIPPSPSRWATDTAGFLSPGALADLDSRLEAFQRTTGHQVLVYIAPTTGDTPTEDWTVRAFAAWKVGSKGLDDGLILFVFAQDKKVRIEVGYGLEGVVPDAIASRIIREVIVPRIEKGDPDGAVTAGVQALLGVVAPQAGGAPGEDPSQRRLQESTGHLTSQVQSLSLGQKIFFGLLLVGFLILLVTHPGLAIYLLFSLLSGGRGGGGGGGGFSGGGGSSGGGGASGSW
jgi:uncharacterized protein